MTRHGRRLFRFPMLAVLLLSACSNSTSPGQEAVALRLTAPANTLAGESFTLRLEAVGSDGSVPITGVAGEVTLTVNAGTITPGAVNLVNGSALAQVSLSVGDGPVVIHAVTGSLSGTTSITLGAPGLLSGDPASPAVEAIPDRDYNPQPADYPTDHPDLPGLGVSHTVLGINLEPAATVAEVNVLLASLDARIVGGVAAPGGLFTGLLMLRVPLDSHGEMDQLLADLETNGLVRSAARDRMLSADRVPDERGNDPAWYWDEFPFGGNWGFEMSRVPQMWNLEGALQRRGVTPIPTGVIDTGVADHPDLAVALNLSPNFSHDHGTHVAGTIAALPGNRKGVDGVTPHAALYVGGMPATNITWLAVTNWIVALAKHDAAVINLSLGTHWDKIGIDPGASVVVRTLLALEGRTFRNFHEGIRTRGEPVLLVGAAGNASRTMIVDSRYNSPWNNAALDWGWEHVIVVEAAALNVLDRSVYRAPFSNPGGHVSAPGAGILSTIPGGGYGFKEGTSMAAPFVTGLVNYLLAVDPQLDHRQIVDLLQANALPIELGNNVQGSRRVDAFGSVIDIDRLRGNTTVLKMLLDIDDGTPDGNLRVDPRNPGVDYLETDVDGNGGPGDGNIDMADFRRWRDLYLETLARLPDAPPGLDLDGSADHPKRDINGDGVVAEQEYFPLADFNGDGLLDPNAVELVAGVFAGRGPLSDLDVLKELFFDLGYGAQELDALILSGDLHVDAGSLFGTPGVDEVFSQVTNDLGIVDTYFHSRSDTIHVYSLDPVGGPYDVVAWAKDAIGDTLCLVTRNFEVTLGGDVSWRPECPGLEVVVNLAPFVEPGVPTPLLVRAGRQSAAGDTQYLAGLEIHLSVTGGTAAAVAGFTDADGYFSTEATLDVGSPSLSVIATATDPVTGLVGVSDAAIATPPTSGGDILLVDHGTTLIVHASSQLSDQICEDFFDFRTADTDFSDVSESHSGSCQSIVPNCGGSVVVSASGNIQVEFVRNPLNGNLLSIRTSAMVQANYEIHSGSGCGQISNGTQSQGQVSIRFEVPEGGLAARIVGSFSPAGDGPAPLFNLDTGFFSVQNPNQELAVDESGSFSAGSHRFVVNLRASPTDGMPSGGTQSFELFFGD